MSDYLIDIKNLSVKFQASEGFLGFGADYLYAVNDVSLKVKKGETLGLVGESGCGKTTLGRAVLRLVEASAGEVFFEGHDILKISKGEMRHLRKDMQIVFQDPFASLNPRKLVEDILYEPFVVHKIKVDRDRKLKELLDLVQLSSDSLKKYPHEFSGGQRQRIAIARAISLGPKLLICDEPVSALDVSVQAQIVNLFIDLQKELGLTYIFISHDLSLVEFIADKIAVMYLGKIVESSYAKDFKKRASHPYSNALFSAIPNPDPDTPQNSKILKGDLPSPIDLPLGCHFSPRCPNVNKRCYEEYPPITLKDDEHQYRCFYPDNTSF